MGTFLTSLGVGLVSIYSVNTGKWWGDILIEVGCVLLTALVVPLIKKLVNKYITHEETKEKINNIIDDIVDDGKLNDSNKKEETKENKTNVNNNK